MTSKASREMKMKKKHNPEVNREFLYQLLKLLRVSIPSLLSRVCSSCTTQCLTCFQNLSFYLCGSTWWIVESIVETNPRLFLQHCINWLLIAIPATFINSLICFLECKLALATQPGQHQKAHNDVNDTPPQPISCVGGANPPPHNEQPAASPPARLESSTS